MRRDLCSLAVILGLALAVTGCVPTGGLVNYTYAPAASEAPATAASGGPSVAPSAGPSVAPSAAGSTSPSVEPSAAAPSSSAGAASPPAPSASGAASGGLTLALAEYVVVGAGTMKAGKLDLTITNNGTIPHELLIFKSNRDPKAYPVDAAGDIKEEGGGVALVSDGENIDPGGTQTRSVDLAAGKYLFVCNIPGHFKKGMYELVIVTP